MKKLSPEYREYIRSDRWRKGWRRKSTMYLVCGLDTIFPFLPAHHADHITYTNLTKELPLRDLVPLNKTVHLRMVTPTRDRLRKIFGRKLGNALMAWFLRGCVLWWWFVALSGLIQLCIFLRDL